MLDNDYDQDYGVDNDNDADNKPKGKMKKGAKKLKMAMQQHYATCKQKGMSDEDAKASMMQHGKKLVGMDA